MWGVKQYGGECMPISVLTENVQSSSCIGLRHEQLEDHQVSQKKCPMGGMGQVAVVHCMSAAHSQLQIPRSIYVSAKLNAAPPMLCKCQCYKSWANDIME